MNAPVAIAWWALLLLLSAGAHANELKPYTGEPSPPPLALRDLDGRMHKVADYRGRVVLINFWASWCPPCVRELPSMQRLHRRLANRAFTILAVNMGEDVAVVRKFVNQRVKVTFPILLDSDGATLKAWKVFAFPTSFVLDGDGKIRFALYGELDWDTPEVAAKIDSLLAPAKLAR